MQISLAFQKKLDTQTFEFCLNARPNQSGRNSDGKSKQKEKRKKFPESRILNLL